MGAISITEDLEFYEVVNAFPILRGSLEKLDFNPDEIKEGETIKEFFSRKKMDDDETSILVKRLNRDMKHYMRTGEGFKDKEVEILKNKN